jgi:3-isopropylmalate/(R)-2-methylmalate dehydratase small subunit
MNARAWVFGDGIDTDTLAPGAYMKCPLQELASHCLEAVDSSFAADVRPGDVVVAGHSFGIGSSREQAVQALRHLGVVAVVAKSFAGIFYRNALNLGLLAMVCPDADRIRAGDQIALDGAAAGSIEDLTQGESYSCQPVPAHLLEMVRDGGLVPHLEKRFSGNRSPS